MLAWRKVGMYDNDLCQTQLAYLKDKAGSATVKVEPIHPDEHCFGTAMPRQTMSFAEFLDLVQNPDEAGQCYLTTQYEQDEEEDEEDEEEPVLDPVLPSPTHKLRSDLPLHPRVLGDLVLQQCNLWIGSGRDEKSSGLHHDFHDNLYILLSGHKRFVLFPPSAYPYLHLRGTVTHLHPNGLLVYEEGDRIRADGLDELDAAHWRMAARAQRTTRKRSRASRDESDVHAAYDEAKAAWLALRAKYDEEDEEEEEDDDDDDDDDEGGILENASEAGSEFGGGEDGEEWLLSLDKNENQEPPSFSLIKPYTLHKHFDIHPAMPTPEGATSTTSPLPECPAPLIVDLKPGQMLYLPASWFHEVTSSATGSEPHMALNYWMHPPDGHEAAYTDKEVWDHVRTRVLAAAESSDERI